MDLATILGVLLGVVFIFASILMGGSPALFISPASVMVTIGGAFSAVLVNFPLKQVLGIVGVAKNAIFAKEESPHETIALLVKFAERARREGILALEKQMEEVKDTFLRNGIQLAVDGTEPELLKDIMETELSYLEERHARGRSIFESLGAYAPAWGMIGTLIGLILMLASLDNPDALGPGMALALITTFYGAVVANLIALPLAGKLKDKSKDEVLIRELMIQGILSIQSGDNPRIVEQKLNSFIAPKERKLREG
ncbi:motility protein A [candidate division KSB1 bacterium]|nr:MAG: motility protein A [candidate division KSB1 bacterium]